MSLEGYTEMNNRVQLPVQARVTPVQIQQPQAPEMVYVSFAAEINPTTTEALIAAISQAVNQGVKKVYLMLSTPGGAVMSGLTLYNALRGFPIELTTHNLGNVESIGNTVFMAGVKRYACQHSTFMFHGVSTILQATVATAMGPAVQLGEKDLRERLGGIRADQKRIGSVIKERTALDEAAIETLFLEAQTKDADWALGCGIVHEIREIQIPAGSPVIPLVFQRQGG
jgi:ATP-dependent protease ClpP protease subunit